MEGKGREPGEIIVVRQQFRFKWSYCSSVEVLQLNDNQVRKVELL